MESEKPKILDMKEVFGENSYGYREITHLINSALFDPDKAFSIDAVKFMHNVTKGAYKWLYTHEDKIYLEVKPANVDKSVWFYVGQVPEEFIFQKIDMSISRVVDLTPR